MNSNYSTIPRLVSKSALIISVISILLSVIAIMVSLRFDEDFNVVGVMVTVLCTLVTLLVAWQIYGSLEIKESLNKVAEVEKEVTIAHRKAMVLSLLRLADAFMNVNNNDDRLGASYQGAALDAYFGVIEYWDESFVECDLIDAYQKAIGKLVLFSKRGHPKLYSEDKKEKYIELAKKTKNQQLIGFARNCEVITENNR